MRLLHFLTEADAPSGEAPPEKKEPEKTPEQQEAEDKQKAIESIVSSVEAATDKNQMNSAVQTAAPFYKQWGEEWLKDLEKALSVNIISEVVERFITITRNFSERLTHLKDKTNNGNSRQISKE